MTKKKNNILYLFIILTLSNCTIWQNKRCERVKKHLPQCIEKIYVPMQTIRIDTFYRTYKAIDTVFKLSKDTTRIDTFIVFNQKTKTIITIKHDTIRVSQQTTPDTITKTYIKTVEKYVLKKDKTLFDKAKKISSIVGLLALLVFIFYIMKKLSK